MSEAVLKKELFPLAVQLAAATSNQISAPDVMAEHIKVAYVAVVKAWNEIPNYGEP